MKIKFRGKDVKSKKYVYGFFLNCVDDSVIVDNEGLKTVYPESVAQFVGYDADGKEIYSDDTVVNVHGAEYPFVTDERFAYEDIGKKFSHLKLKGARRK